MKNETATQLSPKADEAWKYLDKKTRKQINKNNPFRNERNNAIWRLRERGVKIDILTEITGLSKSAILYTARKRKKAEPPGKIGQDLKTLKITFEALYNSILTILNDESKEEVIHINSQ